MPQIVSRVKAAESLNGSGVLIWTRKTLLKFIADHSHAWWVADGAEDDPPLLTPTQILNLLVKQTPLQPVKLDFPYRSVTRYLWNDPPTFSIIQSVDPKGYFSHFTAMQLWNMTDQIPKSVYFNAEQPATGGGGSLTQGGLDRAFKGKCRVTSNVTKFRELTIHKINGQNTGRLGVEKFTMDDGTAVDVANAERTLIDIAVRPVYSGGIAEVAKAYRGAAKSVSGNRLATYLKSLNYTYPYHQVIGYYMEKAGNYSDAQLKRIRAIPREFDFYLTYQIKNPAYDEKWRLFVPKGF